MLRPVAELGEDFRGVLAEPGQVPGPGPPAEREPDQRQVTHEKGPGEQLPVP